MWPACYMYSHLAQVLDLKMERSEVTICQGCCGKSIILSRLCNEEFDKDVDKEFEKNIQKSQKKWVIRQKLIIKNS